MPRNRQDRYERMLTQGHRSSLTPIKIPAKESRSAELRAQMIDLIKNGKKLSYVTSVSLESKLRIIVFIANTRRGKRLVSI